MRLDPQERHLIRAAVAKRFGPSARVWLFGSRTDDNARGGDIDLLIDCDEPIAEDLRAALILETELQEALGDQKIDILIAHPGGSETPLHRIARSTGLLL